MDSFERYVIIPLAGILVAGLLGTALGILVLAIASLVVRFIS